MYVRHRNMQQNATFCSSEQVYAKDVTLCIHPRPDDSWNRPSGVPWNRPSGVPIATTGAPPWNGQ